MPSCYQAHVRKLEAAAAEAPPRQPLTAAAATTALRRSQQLAPGTKHGPLQSSQRLGGAGSDVSSADAATSGASAAAASATGASAILAGAAASSASAAAAGARGPGDRPPSHPGATQVTPGPAVLLGPAGLSPDPGARLQSDGPSSLTAPLRRTSSALSGWGSPSEGNSPSISRQQSAGEAPGAPGHKAPGRPAGVPALPAIAGLRPSGPAAGAGAKKATTVPSLPLPAGGGIRRLPVAASIPSPRTVGAPGDRKPLHHPTGVRAIGRWRAASRSDASDDGVGGRDAQIKRALAPPPPPAGGSVLGAGGVPVWQAPAPAVRDLQRKWLSTQRASLAPARMVEQPFGDGDLLQVAGLRSRGAAAGQLQVR